MYKYERLLAMALAEQRANEKDIRERIAEGDIPYIGDNDEFCFTCEQCGECCRNRGDILLNPIDVLRLCRTLQMDPVAFADKYGERYVGSETRLPLIRIDFRDTYGLGGNVIGTRCPFLSNRGGKYFCRVHEGKPFVCYAFPLGRISSSEDGRIDFLIQDDGTCTGARKAKREGIMQNVTAWVGGKEKVDLDREFYEAFNRLLDDIKSWINLKKLSEWQKGKSREYSAWLRTAGKILYEDIDISMTDREYIDHFKATVPRFMKVLCDEAIKSLNEKLDVKPKK